ncbi:MAG TPA: ATP-binding protein [Burkholderiaceae bacterium]
MPPGASADSRAALAVAAGDADTAFDARRGDMPEAALLRQARWIGWRLRALVAAALLGCLALFALTRSLAGEPHLRIDWHADMRGRVVLADADEPGLRDLHHLALAAITGGTASVRPDALLLERSTRWLVDDAERQRHVALHAQLAAAYAQPTVALRFADGTRVDLAPQAGGYASLGALYWVYAALALALYLAGMVALLAQPCLRNLLFATMAWSQVGNLLFIAVGFALDFNLPAGMPAWDLGARTAFDLVTAAAAVHAVALHPTRLPHARTIAALGWAVAAATWLAVERQLLPGWWTTQLAALGLALAVIALLGWSYRLAPHPFAVLARRLVAVSGGSLLALTIAVAASAGQATLQRDIAQDGAVLWSVCFAALLLLVPFLARSQQLMREFALLAAISAVATSLDLLFVTVFSLGQFASLTLALFIALGAYAGARQWLLDRLIGESVLTTGRMFEQLYRIARDVEAQPHNVPEQLGRLLRELFEPLEVEVVDTPAVRTQIVAHGSTLRVPVPDLSGAHDDPRRPTARAVEIRYAHRGRRLFTPEDARLTDRVLEQLRRAIAFDQAVEQGRSEERARLAQDLHDDIGARLLTLMYKAPTPEMEDYVRHTLKDLKTLTRGLAAPGHRLSHAAPEWKADLTQRLAAAHIDLQWSLSYDEDLLLSVVQWSALTRVLRELVSNVIAHAQATLVTVDFQLRDDRLDLSVSDDGVGRAPREWAHGLGLGGVRKRVKQLGGEVEWVELQPHGIACNVHIRGLSQQ